MLGFVTPTRRQIEKPKEQLDSICYSRIYVLFIFMKNGLHNLRAFIHSFIILVLKMHSNSKTIIVRMKIREWATKREQNIAPEMLPPPFVDGILSNDASILFLLFSYNKQPHRKCLVLQVDVLRGSSSQTHTQPNKVNVASSGNSFFN